MQNKPVKTQNQRILDDEKDEKSTNDIKLSEVVRMVLLAHCEKDQKLAELASKIREINEQ